MNKTLARIRLDNLDVSDPASLEAALDAAPPGTLARVTTDRHTYLLHRVPGAPGRPSPRRPGET